MKGNTLFFGILTIGVFHFGLLGSPAVASAQGGCPWCTTPTTCAEVDESAPIGGCYNIGAGCEEISGSCEIIIDPDAGGFANLPFHYVDEAVIDLFGAALDTHRIIDPTTSNEYFVMWGCGGTLSAIFAPGSDGSHGFTELDPRDYARLNLPTRAGSPT